MNEELKTLKNIKFQCEECTEVASVQMLKQEAIKHIVGYERVRGRINNTDWTDGAIFILKHFFNITKEELSDANCEGDAQ